MVSLPLFWAQQWDEGSLSLTVDLAIYPLEAVFRVCYLFTDRCYLFLSPKEDGKVVRVQITKKTQACELSAIAGEFGNELIAQRLRVDIAKETRAIRELIVAQAFAEADFLDGAGSGASYRDDPKEIAK